MAALYLDATCRLWSAQRLRAAGRGLREEICSVSWMTIQTARVMELLSLRVRLQIGAQIGSQISPQTRTLDQRHEH
jgi:hypothetical protein